MHEIENILGCRGVGDPLDPPLLSTEPAPKISAAATVNLVQSRI